VRPLIRGARALVATAIGCFLALVLVFVLTEYSSAVRRSLGIEDWIRYFAIRHLHDPDPGLVFVYRGPTVIRTSLRGDLYSPDLGIDVAPRPYMATYTRDGLRANSSEGPFDIVAIGDSFLEFGEDDRDTLTERLAVVSGNRVANLGVAWYGPYQYVELLKRFGSRLRPKVSAVFFFEGNDFDDIRAYETWRATGEYYFYRDVSRMTLPARFTLAVTDTFTALQSLSVFPRDRPRGLHPSLARVRLRSEVVQMRFGYWAPDLTEDQLRASPLHRQLEQLLVEFRELASLAGSVPVLVFIPTKVGVYGPLVEPDSGETILTRMPRQRQLDEACLTAIRELAGRLQIPFIDLRTPFRALARGGELLYYPFDTHWNSRGREAAAHILTSELPRVTTGWKGTGRVAR